MDTKKINKIQKEIKELYKLGVTDINEGYVQLKCDIFKLTFKEYEVVSTILPDYPYKYKHIEDGVMYVCLLSEKEHKGE